MTNSKNIIDSLETMARDFSSVSAVGSRPKSEIRQRVTAYANSYAEDRIKYELIRLIASAESMTTAREVRHIMKARLLGIEP